MSSGARPGTWDPRSIVTPEAFEISPDLLGRPLAPPRRRLAAILIDGVLIAVLSQAGGLLLGLAAVLVFFRMATRRSERKRTDALARTFRAAVGCFGGVLLLVTGCGLWLVFGPGVGPDVQRELRRSLEGRVQASADLEDVFGGLSEVQAYRRAETAEEAEGAAARVARRLQRVGAPRDEITEALEDLAPDDASWGDEVDGIVRRAMARIDRAAAGAGPAEPPSPGDTTAGPEGAPRAAQSDTGGPAGAGTTAEEVPPEERTLPEALERYATLYRSGPDTSAGRLAGPDSAEARRLRERLVDELGRDTLAVLLERLDEEVEEREDAERRLERTRQELQRAREGRLLGWLRRLADDLGLAFGWGTLYMTIFLSWWNGRTPGKKLLGIRVVQLDDSPISWWEAFERAGGYAAGFATGLLGFAQLYWDPNRQAIHDKISETVVLLEGEQPIPGPWSVRDPGSRP